MTTLTTGTGFLQRIPCSHSCRCRSTGSTVHGTSDTAANNVRATSEYRWTSERRRICRKARRSTDAWYRGCRTAVKQKKRGPVAEYRERRVIDGPFQSLSVCCTALQSVGNGRITPSRSQVGGQPPFPHSLHILPLPLLFLIPYLYHRNLPFPFMPTPSILLVTDFGSNATIAQQNRIKARQWKR